MTGFNDALHSWQNFYFMFGGSAATLLGLMFVALSLGTHLVNETTRDSIQAFVSPNLVYFVSALLVAGAMLVPTYEPPILGLILLVGGAVGLVRIAPSTRRLIAAAREHQDFTRDDWLAQVILPVTGYGLLLLTGVGFEIKQWSLAFTGSAVAMVLLLIAAIANTWSLVLWIIDQRRE
jgi:hypothetical protein